jgi:hypothetical protein
VILSLTLKAIADAEARALREAVQALADARVRATVAALPAVRYTDRQDEPWPVVGRCVP